MSNQRILIVEDEIMIANAMDMFLRHAGYTVVGPVCDFSSALAAAHTDDMDIVLLDLNLNGKKAFPIADILIKRQIPFAVVTGYAEYLRPGNRIKAPVLKKPVDPQRLLNLIRALFTEPLDPTPDLTPKF
jgi:DNA-binding response OmpR family regulator